jgi:hypothetical protein
VLIVRRHVPESPRWLFIHGREEEAEAIVDRIEGDVREETGTDLPEPDEAIEVHPRTSIPFREIASVAFTKYPRRAILALALFVGQAFLYNGVTFNLGTLFSTFYGISSSTVPVFVIAFAVANFMGPLFLGRLFDTVGRKAMISFTYLGSAVVAAVAAWLFANHYLHSPWAFEALIMLTFFLASAGASSAYLTASEIFPMETRALAIAFFYAVGTAAGGITGPLLFGRLIESASRDNVAIAFWIGAAVMAVGGLAALLWAVPAEQASLESIATPLTAADEEEAEAGVGHEAEVHPDHRRALEERQRAEEERARAAEHDAAAIELRAESDAHAGERASLEEALADVARARARMHDALADANDEREEAEAAGEAERAAADERVSAAVQRAWASHQEAEAPAAGDAGEERRFGEYAEAAREASRARSQRADAAEARARAAGLEGAAAAREEAMADVHDAWTRVHEARSRLHERHADGGALGDEEEIAHLEAAARAAEERLHAAEFRVAADEAGGEAADEADRERRQQERADRERRARERDDRIRNRIDRRNRRERAGLRRYRPGPGSTFYSPGMIGTPVGSSSRTTEEAIDSAVETLANVLRERGEMSREDLARAAGARYWGPGVFRAALREAEQDGAVRRVSRSTYGPSEGR